MEDIFLDELVSSIFATSGKFLGWFQVSKHDCTKRKYEKFSERNEGVVSNYDSKRTFSPHDPIENPGVNFHVQRAPRQLGLINRMEFEEEKIVFRCCVFFSSEFGCLSCSHHLRISLQFNPIKNNGPSQGTVGFEVNESSGRGKQEGEIIQQRYTQKTNTCMKS